MGWASGFIDRLRRGETVQFRPRGHSMTPRIRSGQLVTVAPIEGDLRVDDVVLCRVRGQEYLHFIKAITVRHFQIGNARGHINGWVTRNAIFGVLTKVEP